MGKEIYLKKLFQSYYKSVAPNFPSYSDLAMREFGFIQWDVPGMTRHKGFTDLPTLLQFLQKMGPRHTYISTTGYLHPDWPDMGDKGFQFCDFVTDIDMDHFHTECKNEHDHWTCKNCGQVGPGEPPETCPECGAAKFDEFNWLCNECLGAAKQEFMKVIDFLERDFGIERDNMHYYFSGNRGYHAHVEDARFRQLDGEARRELTDYLTSIGINLEALGFSTTNNRIRGFTKNMPGWSGRIARFLEHYLRNATPEKLVEDVGMQQNRANKISTAREQMLQVLNDENSNWFVKGVKSEAWLQLCDFAVRQISPNIDIPVSLDIHRLIRLPFSLHGKTGFRVTALRYDEIAGFDPFRDSLVFGNQPLKVLMKPCPQFRIEDSMYGPFDAPEVIELPANAGIFALCQGVANFPQGG